MAQAHGPRMTGVLQDAAKQDRPLITNLWDTLTKFGKGSDPDGDRDETRRSLLRDARKLRRELGTWLKDERKKLEQGIAGRGKKLHRRWRKAVTGDEETRIRDHSKRLVERAGATLQTEMQKEPVIRMVDRVSFTMGVLALVLIIAILCGRPNHFWLLYCMVVPTLLVLRYFHYQIMRWWHFTLDFCYFVQYSCLVSVLLLPNSADLWKLNFVWCNGPLAIAVIVWRNSLVFHSWDKVTSWLIHMMPAILTWTVRWQGALAPILEFQLPSARVVVGGGREQPSGATSDWSTNVMCQATSSSGAGEQHGSCSLSFTEAVSWPLLGYCGWQALYLFKTEVIDGRLLREDKTLMTSVRWLAGDRRNGLNKLTVSICRKLGVLSPKEYLDPETTKTKIIFCTVQLIYTIATVLPAMALFEYFWLHTLFLSTVFAVSVWYGATYYIDVFTDRYSQQFEKLIDRAESADLNMTDTEWEDAMIDGAADADEADEGKRD